MRIRMVSTALIVLLACTFTFGLVQAAPPNADIDISTPQSELSKEYISDGSVYHQAGLAWLNITNIGVIGSRYSAPSSMSSAPSLRYPGENGREHLWAGSLWVGGTLLGETLVSTGQYAMELCASADPVDTIYEHGAGCPGGSRYPEASPDDDGDGLEDEDPPNGLDDDGDGLIDEDFAAFGAEYFVCTLSDTTRLAIETYPDHTPLGIQVIQETFQFDDPLNDDYVGLRYTIRNINTTAINDVYVGFLADFDIEGIAGGLGESGDDHAATWLGLARASNDTYVPVSISYSWDSKASATSAYAGIALLSSDLRAAQIFSGMSAYGQGGDPTNDSERYETLSEAHIDPNPSQAGDYRNLLSAGPWAGLAPGDEIDFDVALVCGADLDELLLNAANARVTYEGHAFDRDGNPATGPDGCEFHVHWLRDEDIPVAALSGVLIAEAVGSSAHLRLGSNVPELDRLNLRRAARGGFAGRQWTVADLDVDSTDDGHKAFVIDNEAVGWPRSYTLVYNSGGRELILDEVVINADPIARPRIETFPNPFNPQLEISWELPEAGPMQMTVFDGRGRLVHTLISGNQPAGNGHVVWRGDDEAGRPMPSGVYVVRLTTTQGATKRNVSLVR